MVCFGEHLLYKRCQTDLISRLMHSHIYDIYARKIRLALIEMVSLHLNISRSKCILWREKTRIRHFQHWYRSSFDRHPTDESSKQH